VSGPPAGARGGTSRRLSRAARRIQLLEAAQHVFVSHGYHAAGMDEIAERAGVSKPVLYQHFESKLELYLALLEQHAAAFTGMLGEALHSTTDNYERVRRSITAFFDFVGAKGGAYQLVFESDLRREPAVNEVLERMSNQCRALVAETIALDTGFAPEETELLSVSVTGIAEVAARWWLTSEHASTVPRERAVDLLVLLTWRGIGGSPLRVEGPVPRLPLAESIQDPPSG
jgi:AcrR family transcriptional regulator